MAFFTMLIMAALYIWYDHRKPIRCESVNFMKVNDLKHQRTIFSEGSMLMTFFNDATGVGVYIGDITYEENEKIVQRNNVNKTFKFTYSIKYDQLTIVTETVISNMGNRASDDEAQRYIYPGFQKGKIMHGTLLNIGGTDTYAVAENMNPKSICHKVLNDKI